MREFSYTYTTGYTIVSGAFNIYQARSGAIMLLINEIAVPFTLHQIDGLKLDIYHLVDFDIDNFNKYYKL